MTSSFVFGDFAKIESGYAFKSTEWLSNGVPVVKIRNIKDGIVTLEDCSFVSDDVAKRAADFRAQGGDILISLTGYVGQVGRVLPSDEVLVNQRVGFVKPKHPDDLDFIYYLLRFLRQQIEELGTGTAQANVAPKDIMNLSIPNVSKESRTLIGRLLGNLDEKIAANNAISKTLENIAQTIFKSWFVDFDPTKAKMRGEQPEGMDDATAALFPDSLEESELGMIPKGWKTSVFGDVLSVLESGKRPKGGAQSEGVPSIGAESIRNLGQFDFASTKYVSPQFFQTMNSGKVKPYDVLVYKDGAGAGSHVTMFGEGFPYEYFAINEHVFLLRSNQVPQPYLFFWLNNEKYKSLMVELAQKSAQPGLNQKDMKSIPILKPDSSILSAFSELISPILEMIMKNSLQSFSLTQVREGLLPRLISGELQIPEELLVS